MSDVNPPVEIEALDIAAFAAGNTGVPYVTTFTAAEPGPHAVITALVHGNELCGVHALVHLLGLGLRPARGRLTLAFVNVEAYRRFDPASPHATRFVDEDFNRVWDEATLDGRRRSVELDRAREIRPVIEDADWLLDLHSMQLPSPPLLLCGTTDKGRRLARAMGWPATVVADAGHRAGARMRDFGAFGDPASPRAAMLVECGQHWARSSIEVAIATCRQFLAATEMVDAAMLEAICPAPPLALQHLVEVSEAVTVESGPFRFVDPYLGLEEIPQAGTVIAYDGSRPVCTPYDRCILIMPSRRLVKGLTAVRLGRQVVP